MTAASKAEVDDIFVKGQLSGLVEWFYGLATLNIVGSISYEDKVVSTINSKATSLRFVLIPSGVQLALTRGTDGAAFIDCPAWTNNIQAAYDANGAWE